MKAFPTTYRNYDESINHDCTGMDLRDYFAAKAMPIITETYKNSWIEDNNFEGYSDEEMICIAEGSYEMADAMIEARSK